MGQPGVIHALTFPTVTDMHEGMCEKLMFGETKGVDWDWTHGTEVGLHNVTIHCDAFDWSYDLADLWMPRSRWTMMVRQYIDPDALADWRAKVEDRLSTKTGRGIAVLRTNTVQGKGAGRGVRRRWGSCMLALSFRRVPVPTVTLHSRTTYFGYLAAMDLTVAHAFAREASIITGIPVHGMEFVWNLELAQFHGFRSLAWPLMKDDILEMLNADVDSRLSFKVSDQPGYRKALDGYARILKSDRAGTLYGDESFSSFARVRRRFHTEVYGPEYAAQFAGGTRNNGSKVAFTQLPPLMTDSLDFSPLRNGVTSGVDDDDDWMEDDDAQD